MLSQQIMTFVVSTCWRCCRWLKTNNFEGVNAFSRQTRKLFKISNYYKTTVPILTKFCTTITTTKYSSWVVQICVQQIQDGGHLTAILKIENHSISVTLTNFTVTHTELPDPEDLENFEFLKIQYNQSTVKQQWNHHAWLISATLCHDVNVSDSNRQMTSEIISLKPNYRQRNVMVLDKFK